jgi:hypothetical protein
VYDRWSGVVAATLVPLLLTAVLFLGPLVMLLSDVRIFFLFRGKNCGSRSEPELRDPVSGVEIPNPSLKIGNFKHQQRYVTTLFKMCFYLFLMSTIFLKYVV